MKLSVSHRDLTMVRFEINSVVVDYQTVDQEFVVNIENQSNVEIFFEPWGIKPLIRIDNHLINYGLADVKQFDHMVKLHWSLDFYQKYQQRDIESKMEYLGLTKQEDIDYYLGINNSNTDIVEQIKDYLK